MARTDPDPDDLVPAMHAATEFEARTKATVLEDAGIDAFVFHEEMGWLGASSRQFHSRGVPVFVRRGDAETARNLLESRIEDSIDIDWSEVDVGEPDDSPEHSRVAGPVVFIILAAIILILALALGLWE